VVQFSANLSGQSGGQYSAAVYLVGCLPQGLFPTSSTTCSPTTRLFMEFATETQTGPSRWTTDDVDIIAPTAPELQHSPRKWPVPVTLLAVAILSLIIGMHWWEARRKRKLRDWRVARSVSSARCTQSPGYCLRAAWHIVEDVTLTLMCLQVGTQEVGCSRRR
jgi:hypothetical protein